MKWEFQNVDKWKKKWWSKKYTKDLYFAIFNSDLEGFTHFEWTILMNTFSRTKSNDIWRRILHTLSRRRLCVVYTRYTFFLLLPYFVIDRLDSVNVVSTIFQPYNGGFFNENTDGNKIIFIRSFFFKIYLSTGLNSNALSKRFLLTGSKKNTFLLLIPTICNSSLFPANI